MKDKKGKPGVLRTDSPIPDDFPTYKSEFKTIGQFARTDPLKASQMVDDLRDMGFGITVTLSLLIINAITDLLRESVSGERTLRLTEHKRQQPP